MPENFSAQAKDFYRRGMTMQKIERVRKNLGFEIPSDRWELIQGHLIDAFSNLDKKEVPLNRHLMGDEEFKKK